MFEPAPSFPQTWPKFRCHVCGLECVVEYTGQYVAHDCRLYRQDVPKPPIVVYGPLVVWT